MRISTRIYGQYGSAKLQAPGKGKSPMIWIVVILSCFLAMLAFGAFIEHMFSVAGHDEPKDPAVGLDRKPKA